jgi:hypothetical protein
VTLAHEEFQRGEALAHSPAEAKGVHDRMLRRLSLAAAYWRLSEISPRSERLAMAHDLDDGELSLSNIAALTRLSVTTVSRHLPERERNGGRFAPESLSSLRYLRSQVIQGQKPSFPQLRAAVEAGTSLATAARLIGVSNPHLYQAFKR